MNNDEDLLAGGDTNDTPTPTPTPAAKKPRKKPAKKEKTVEAADATSLLDDTPPPAKKSKAPAKKTEAKKPVKEKTPAKKPVKEKAVKAPKEKKAKAVSGPPENVKPTLPTTQISVLAYFAGNKNRWTNEDIVAKACVSKKDDALVDAFVTANIKPMIKKGILEYDKASNQIRPVPEKFCMQSKELIKFIQKIPTDPEKGLSAGVIGGNVWGKKDEAWINVRYGRAAGAQLHTLAKVGAVGYTRIAPGKPALWYRLAAE